MSCLANISTCLNIAAYLSSESDKASSLSAYTSVRIIIKAHLNSLADLVDSFPISNYR